MLPSSVPRLQMYFSSAMHGGAIRLVCVSCLSVSRITQEVVVIVIPSQIYWCCSFIVLSMSLTVPGITSSLLIFRIVYFGKARQCSSTCNGIDHLWIGARQGARAENWSQSLQPFHCNLVNRKRAYKVASKHYLPAYLVVAAGKQRTWKIN